MKKSSLPEDSAVELMILLLRPYARYGGRPELCGHNIRLLIRWLRELVALRKAVKPRSHGSRIR